MEEQRYLWELKSNYEEILFRLKELGSQWKVYNTLSTYFFKIDEVMILETLTEITPQDQYNSKGDGLYDPPTAQYICNIFNRNSDQWTPKITNRVIDRETFYRYTTSEETDKIISCIHIAAELNGNIYRFDFNFEKKLNTITVVCDEQSRDKVISPFLRNVEKQISEFDYRRILFDDVLQIEK